MSHNTPITFTNLSEPEWPPEFAQYTDQDLTDENVVTILERESRNKKAPDEYKVFFSRLTKHYHAIVKKINSDEKTMQQLQTSCDKYTQYVLAARENYDNLSELYQEQHTRVLELEEEQIQKGVDLESEKQQQEQVTTQLRENIALIESQKEALAKDFENYKVESTINAEKQGVGRFNLENILIEKERQIDELKKTTTELQAVLKQKTREVDDANTKYKAITTLLQGTRQVPMNL